MLAKKVSFRLMTNFDYNQVVNEYQIIELKLIITNYIIFLFYFVSPKQDLNLVIKIAEKGRKCSFN